MIQPVHPHPNSVHYENEVEAGKCSEGISTECKLVGPNNQVVRLSVGKKNLSVCQWERKKIWHRNSIPGA